MAWEVRAERCVVLDGGVGGRLGGNFERNYHVLLIIPITEHFCATGCVI